MTERELYSIYAKAGTGKNARICLADLPEGINGALTVDQNGG